MKLVADNAADGILFNVFEKPALGFVSAEMSFLVPAGMLQEAQPRK